MDNFNFDEWAELYRTDPEAYERRRSEYLNEYIMNAPVENRNDLRMLQLEVDTIRNMYPPDEALKIIMEMLVERLKTLKTTLTQARQYLEDLDED